MLLVILPAFASEPAVSGSWTIGVSRSAVQERQRVAVNEAVDSMNRLVRGIARKKIRKHLRYCSTMELTLDPGRFLATCGGGPVVDVPRPGPGTWTDDEGDTYRTTLKVEADTVVMDVRNDDGGQTTTYRLEGDRIVTTTTLSSPKLPEPVSWTVPYERAP